MERTNVRKELREIFDKALDSDYHGKVWGLINELVDIEQTSGEKTQ